MLLSNDRLSIGCSGNGASDCLTPEGEICVPSDTVSVGYADQCLTNGTGLTIEHTFEISGGGALIDHLMKRITIVTAMWSVNMSVLLGLDHSVW